MQFLLVENFFFLVGSLVICPVQYSAADVVLPCFSSTWVPRQQARHGATLFWFMRRSHRVVSCWMLDLVQRHPRSVIFSSTHHKMCTPKTFVLFYLSSVLLLVFVWKFAQMYRCVWACYLQFAGGFECLPIPLVAQLLFAVRLSHSLALFLLLSVLFFLP